MALDVYKEWLGIPEGPRPPDHYTLLRIVQFEDDAEKIRKNYRKLNGHVRKYASGQFSQQSQVLLNELAKAMLCLTDSERKREYDRSLGREVDDRDEATGRRPLTAYLMDDGLLNSAQIEQAKNHAEKAGLSLRDAVVQLKLVDADTAARAYAKELGRSFVDLNETVPDDEALNGLPKNVARRHTCLPLFVDEEFVLVACADEPSMDLEDEIRLRFSKPIRVAVATPLAINQGIATHYSAVRREEAAAAANAAASGNSVATAATTTKPAPSPKPVKEKVQKAPLTPEQKVERRNLGYIIIFWTLIVTANLDNWVLHPKIWKSFMPGWFPFLLALLVVPPVAFTVYNTHIKE